MIFASVFSFHHLPVPSLWCTHATKSTLVLRHSSFLCVFIRSVQHLFLDCHDVWTFLQHHQTSLGSLIKYTQTAESIIACIYVFFISYSIPYLYVAGTRAENCVTNRFASGYVLGELYHWLTEIIIFIVPFISLLTMNSFIIHTLRQRSKLKLLELGGEGQTQGKNLKMKSSEKQIFTMALLVTFVFLFLNIFTRALVFYLNFYSGNTPYYYAGLHLFYQVGEKCHYKNYGVNFFLYVMSGQNSRTDLKNLFHVKKSNANVDEMSSIPTKISSIGSEENWTWRTILCVKQPSLAPKVLLSPTEIVPEFFTYHKNEDVDF